MQEANKYLLVPAQDAARFEVLKGLHTKSVVDHAKHLESEKEKLLLNQSSLPLDMLLKKYTDALQKYQSYIDSLKVEPAKKVSARPKKQSDLSSFFTTPREEKESTEDTQIESEVSGEELAKDDEELITSGDEDGYEKPNLDTLPKSRQHLATSLFRKMETDPALKLVGKNVYLGDKNLGSSKGLIAFFVQKKRERVPDAVVNLAKHWVKEKLINVETEVENPKLKSVLSPARSPLHSSRLKYSTPKSSSNKMRTRRRRQSPYQPTRFQQGGGASRWMPNPIRYLTYYK